MRRRLGFVRRATLSGWDWLVEVCNHVGAALLVLAAIGVSFLSAVKLPHWWLGILIFFGLYSILFAEGAFRVWSEADQQARAASGSPDTAEAKRAYLTRELKYGRELRDEAKVMDNEAWFQNQEGARIAALLLEWETTVGSRLRRDFGPSTERQFSRNDDGGADTFTHSNIAFMCDYIDRRCRHLEAIRDAL